MKIKNYEQENAVEGEAFQRNLISEKGEVRIKIYIKKLEFLLVKVIIEYLF